MRAAWHARHETAVTEMAHLPFPLGLALWHMNPQAAAAELRSATVLSSKSDREPANAWGWSRGRMHDS